ncbi:hypothetical protein M514_06879 [Trichuris suis]|uniref:Cystatin domain-containing protein n=1 Tax=Trichuris suis TaxID=68888 RepID=A0A085M520_9BILA|nr:hypothetical protein M513_06879 [Trichuris suis]KFD66767.1 hypothetical protein M514_06879 [Trichuris suis]
MVALLKLAVALLCLASVSATEKALLDKFAQAAVNGINNDNRSGEKLYVVQSYDEVKETDDGITFDLFAVQTQCRKRTKLDKAKCVPNEDSSVLYHKVIVTKKPNGAYSVKSVGSMVPIEPDIE